MLEPAELLTHLQHWSEAGWIRRLDRAFAAFMLDLCPQTEAPVLLAAALLAHMEGRGHSCLALDELLADPAGLLGWPPLAAESLRLTLRGLPGDAAVWVSALQRSPLVWVDGSASASLSTSLSVSTSLSLPADESGAAPLVLRGAKLYLRRYWAYEQRVAAQVLLRAALQQPVDQPAARAWLDRLFPAANHGTAEPAPFDWQKFACAVALRSRLSVITGGPGTGKTYTAARLLALLFAVDAAPQRLRIGLAAPTGKAAARLKQSIEAALGDLQLSLGESLPLLELASHIGAARTLHSLLGARPDTRKLRADAAHPLELDVLIVDEASMIHLEMMAALLEALPVQARVIFLGDKDQLASVEAGAVLGDLCRDAEQGRYTAATAAFAVAVTRQEIPAAYLADLRSSGAAQALAQQTVMLRESRRFGGPIGQLALAANGGDARTASTLLRAETSPALHWLDAPTAAAAVRLAVEGRAGVPGGYRSYLQVLKQRPVGADRPAFDDWVRRVLAEFERFRLLCAVREGEWGALGLNQAVERALVSQGLLVKSADWYVGRPVMVTRNDHGIGVFNGDIGIVLKPFAGAASGVGSGAGAGLNLRAYFSDGQALRSVGVSRLADVETAFAMTVHKSQGSEFEHTVLVLPQEASRVLTRELVYTGITRARQAFTLVTGWPQGFANALGARTRRASGLLELLSAGL